MVGARVKANIDAHGQLTEVRLVPRAGAGHTVPAGDWGDSGNPSSEAGFRRLIAQLIPVLPEAAPAAGQTWWAQAAESLPEGKATTERRYTYEGSEERGGRPTARLALTFTRQTENKAGEKGSSTNGTGAAYFDAAAGRLSESSLTHTRKLEVASDDAKLTRKVTETIALKLADPPK